MTDPIVPAPTPQTSSPTLTHDHEATERLFKQIQTAILWAAGAAFVIFVIWAGISLAAESAQRQVQKEYLTLTDDAGRAAFAKRHANHPLGGLVLLGQANDYYNRADYAAAYAAYSQALSGGLKTQTILHEQALLGQAFSQYALDTDKGLELLSTIAKNPELMHSTRAYAACELAGYWALKGNFEKARDFTQLVRTLPNARPWQVQAENLKEIYTEIAEKK